MDIDDTASTELTRDNIPFCTREEKKIREKNLIAVTRSCRFHINVQDSRAWNSLFKCIKIQHMQVF